MPDLANSALQIVASVACAVGIDWALQFRIQLMYSAASAGEGPRPYRIGPAHKLLLMALYIAALNWSLFRHEPDQELAFIAVGTLFLIYVADATFVAVRMMKEGAEAS